METILNRLSSYLITKVYADANTIIDLPQNSKWTSFDGLINDVLKYLVWIAVGACFIFFSIGALQIIFNSGEPAQLAKARGAMMWSAFGLVIIIVGYVMLKWVGGLFGYTSIF